MDLLHQIIRAPVDPDYAIVAARGSAPPRLRWSLALVAAAVGLLFTIAAVQTTSGAPALEAERRELIARIRIAEEDSDRLRSRATALAAHIDTLRMAALGEDSTAQRLEQQINALDPVVGRTAVTGPGLVVVVDDATATAEDARDRVLDLDLQILVNGLWQSGAEAIAVNGHRLSALTAIRGAGDAITVDYRSLTGPYRVEAIGDPRTLESRWVESVGGAWWNELAQNRSMRYDVTNATELTLPADPGMVLRYARRVPR